MENIIWFTKSTDNIKAHTFCPSCQSKKVLHLPAVGCQCYDCGTKYITPLFQSMAEKKMGEIVYKLHSFDEVLIKAELEYEQPLNHVHALF